MSDLHRAAMEEGNFSYNQLRADSFAKKIVDAVIQNNGGGKTWAGPLPKPRRSPPMTLGAAIDKAKVISPKRSSSASSRQMSHGKASYPTNSSSPCRRSPAPAKVNDARSEKSGYRARSLDDANSNFKCRSLFGLE